MAGNEMLRDEDRRTLEGYGWCGRASVDSDAVVEELRRVGHEPGEAAWRILNDLLGFEYRREGLQGPAVRLMVRIDPRESARILEPESLDELAGIAGTGLTVAGDLYDSQYVLLLGEDGCWFATTEDGLWRLGTGAGTVIGALCRGDATLVPLRLPGGW